MTEEATEEGRYRPGTAARMGLLAGAIVLGWFAVRGAAQKSLLYSAPQLAAQFWPADGVSLAFTARQRVAAASGEIDGTTRALFTSALEKEPLLADPLVLAGLDAAAAGDDDRAERLMLAARGRDPRSSVTRFWLLDHYARTGRYRAALDEVGPAIQLQPDSITAVMTLLAAIADNPDGRAALADKLRARPYWRTQFFQTAANSTSPDAMLSLLSQSSGDNRAAAEEQQRAVFLSMIGSGKGVQAFEAWRAGLPTAFRSQAQGIYDGNFARWPGARPFNWMLTNSEIGSARMVTAGDLPQSTALDVRYFGSTGGVLAQQFVFSPPGSYQLQFAARRRTSGATGGRLSMEVRCASGAVIANLPLEPLSMSLRTLAAPVDVAPGCEMMRVQLVGTPGEVFSEVEAQITGVTLLPSR